MGNELVVLNNEQQMQAGGIGLGAAIFKGRPQSLELVQRTTRQEGAIPGKFRVIATNDHMDEMRVVLLAVPQEQREWYQGAEFTKENKQCFSTDNKQPHVRAKNPPAMYCATCPKGDINWEAWRKDKRPENLPPCNLYYHLFLADKATQTPYYLNVKGQSVMPFKNAMETQMFGLLQKVVADVKAKNKLRGYTLNPKTGAFLPAAGFIVPEGTKQEEPLPLPNIFDISFTMCVTTRDKGGPPVIACKDFRLLQDEQRAEFGAMYLEFAQRKADGRADADAQLAAAAEAEAQQANAVVTEVTAPVAPAVVLPGPVVKADEPIVGTVVNKDEPITI